MASFSTVATASFSPVVGTYQQPIALIVAFALLGLAGQSANPILVALAVRYGDRSPTLAGAMPTSLFNVGTALGTSLTGFLLTTTVGMAAPGLVGSLSAALVLIPLGCLTYATSSARRAPAAHATTPETTAARKRPLEAPTHQDHGS